MFLYIVEIFSGENDYDTVGQVIITDQTQWADLLDDNESGEWRKEKNKDKDLVMCCTLHCDSGYKASGRNWDKYVVRIGGVHTMNEVIYSL